MAKKKKFKLNALEKFIIIVLLISFFLMSGWFYLNIFYSHKIFLNVYLNGESYSGLTAEQVNNLLENKFAKIDENPLVFDIENKEFTSSLTDLGITLSASRTTEEIYSYARSTNFLNDSFLQFKLLFSKKSLDPVYLVNFDRFNNKIASIFSQYDVSAQNAVIVFKNGQFSISDAQAGNLVDKSQLIKDLKIHALSFDQNPIKVVRINEQPGISADQLTEALGQVKNAQKKRVTLAYDYDRWSLGGEKLLEVLNFGNFSSSNDFRINFLFSNRLIELRAKDKGTADKVISVGFDNEKINSFVDSIAVSIDRPTKDATLRFEAGKVSVFTPAIDGQTLDRDQLRDILLKNVLRNDSESDAIINLPVKVVKAKIANSEVNSLGIKELIGSGVSYFSGSIPNRIFNITLGAKLISGTIVKPGEIFSFNSLVGPVSAEQGFRQAYVINKGRTVLDDGGGICQVSTTVFRAALNSGLPIIKRTAHAYRVGYYELNGFKPGIDATIFSPSVDFQFKNDTDNSILVQAVVDPAISKLQVDIYGTLDGRRVEMSDVKVSNVTPAPDPLYQDDPTLPTGVVKQVDFAAAGATSVFTRKVYKGDQLILDDTFKSVFKPWQAVYLVGKG